ncbi:hypothetical protein MSBRW_2453 [Methanosarcina barkeri str. Wiesmoor]|uniref:Pentapeptide repeat family protein n=2 Tax=Methanosarcina barkeri TaxID=2208 RepID=A0A0E3LLR0_METBA|nr:pentapeptide repeat-containing protein [Methanosarcina barkeri]AKB51706.1 hypothetical protein MSBRW_2453 [Methanosarcina barkeri str. Wiesmoor]
MKKKYKVIHLVIKVALLIIGFIIIGLIWWFLPILAVYQFSFGITISEMATLENQYRVTLTQAFGGIAILYGVYLSWKRINIAEDNLKATQKSLEIAKQEQITERFTRAVDQLGRTELEIRLGGIYALEKIASESEEYYSPVLEILTAYIRKNSGVNLQIKGKSLTYEPESIDFQANENANSEKINERKLPLDIQAILTVIGRRQKYFSNGESNRLNLQDVYLMGANFKGFHLEGACFRGSYLHGAIFIDAHLEGANFAASHLEWAKFRRAHLEDATFTVASLKHAYFRQAHLERSECFGAKLESADFTDANLYGARNLDIDMLSKVKTLHGARLNETLRSLLKEKYPNLFDHRPDTEMMLERLKV